MADVKRLWNRLAAAFRPQAESAGPTPVEPIAPAVEASVAVILPPSVEAPEQPETRPAAAVERETSAVRDGVRRPGPGGSPFSRAVTLVPSDTTLLDPTRGLWIGGGGDVVLDLVGGAQAVTFAAVPAGSFLPVRAVRLRAATSEGADVVALY
jgi:hypothetical protein